MSFDVVLFGILGLVGLLFLLLWTATDHKAAAKNFNLLWALPTHLVAVVAFIRQPQWLRKYFLIVAVLTGLLLISWFFLPQKMNTNLIPLVLAILARATAQYLVRKERARL